jgi:hypothetical protein
LLFLSWVLVTNMQVGQVIPPKTAAGATGAGFVFTHGNVKPTRAPKKTIAKFVIPLVFGFLTYHLRTAENRLPVTCRGSPQRTA